MTRDNINLIPIKLGGWLELYRNLGEYKRERVKYKLGVITRRCLYGSAPMQYLAACGIPVSKTVSRQHLRSAASHQLVIPSHRRTLPTDFWNFFRFPQFPG